MTKERKRYTPGMEDIERTLDHLDDEERKARKIAWLKEHYSKQGRTPTTKEVSDESNRQP